MTVAREISDMAALTTLADYDDFLQERFGLFALSQDADIQNTYNDAYKQGAELLGNSISADSINASVNGVLPLAQSDVLKQQLLDYGELTVLSEVLLEDLNLQELIDKIKELMQITALLDVMTATSNFTKSINALVEEGNNLVGYIDSIKTNAETIVTNVDDLCTKVAALYETIATGDGLPDFSDEKETKAFIETYYTTIEDIYKSAQTLSETYSALSSATRSRSSAELSLTPSCRGSRASRCRPSNGSIP